MWTGWALGASWTLGVCTGWALGLYLVNIGCVLGKLDWVLTENATCISNMMVNPPLGPSDHSLLSFDYYCFIEKDSNDDPSGYSYFNGKYEAMREELDSPEWIESILSLNVQEAWNNISNKITGLIERYITKKKYTHNRSPPYTVHTNWRTIDITFIYNNNTGLVGRSYCPS